MDFKQAYMESREMAVLERTRARRAALEVNHGRGWKAPISGLYHARYMMTWPRWLLRGRY